MGSALQGQLQLGHIVTRLITVSSVWSILLSVHPSLHLGVFHTPVTTLAASGSSIVFFL
jgi:hypothetical protein